MATPRVEAYGLESPSTTTTTTTKTTVSKLIPVLIESPAKNPIFFPAILVGLQAIFIVLFGLHAEYGREPLVGIHPAAHISTVRSTTTFPNGTTVALVYDVPISYRGIADFYSIFQDVHVMIFVGLGFLVTFFRRYGYSAVGFNFLLAAFVIEWALIVRGYIFDFNLKTHKFAIDVERMIAADFVAAAVLISFGAVVGKTNPTQLIIMGFIEVLLQISNQFLGLHRFCAYDIGQSMFIHAFGAFFGIGVAFMLYDKELTSIEAEQREKPAYHSNLFSLIGTLFLFCFWPSFNAASADSGDARLRSIVNTYLSIASSVLVTYICSCLFSKEKQFSLNHIQYATLAGGVAVGTVADKVIHPFGALIVGSIGGALSTVGFRFIRPVLQKLRIHDTCGVSNLHGLPGLLAGIFGIILAIFPTYSLYRENLLDSCWHGQYRTYLGQIGYQAAALVATIAIAVIGGLITGVILRLPLLNDQRPSAYYNDRVHWDVPDDFYQDVTTVLVPSHVEHHVLA